MKNMLNISTLHKIFTIILSFVMFRKNDIIRTFFGKKLAYFEKKC